jgi:hypothetical protein
MREHDHRANDAKCCGHTAKIIDALFQPALRSQPLAEPHAQMINCYDPHISWCGS